MMGSPDPTYVAVTIALSPVGKTDGWGWKLDMERKLRAGLHGALRRQFYFAGWTNDDRSVWWIHPEDHAAGSDVIARMTV